MYDFDTYFLANVVRATHDELEPNKALTVFLTCASYSEATHSLSPPTSLAWVMSVRDKDAMASSSAIRRGYATSNGKSYQPASWIKMRFMRMYGQGLEGSHVWCADGRGRR